MHKATGLATQFQHLCILFTKSYWKLLLSKYYAMLVLLSFNGHLLT